MAIGSDGTAMPMVSVNFRIRSYSAQAAYNLLRDKAGSVNWHKDVGTTTDLTCHLGQEAHPVDDMAKGPPGSGSTSLRLWLTSYKIPSFAKFVGLPPREVLEYRVCSASDPDGFLIVGSSTGTETLGIPTSKGFKRAHLNIGGYAFIPCVDGGCEMRTVSHLNPGGVPSWVLDMIATRKPKEFVDAFLAQLGVHSR